MMFQFSELLTLVSGLVMLVYLAYHAHRVAGIAHLRLLVLPVVLTAVAWIATVLEGVFLPAVPAHDLVVLQQASIVSAHIGGPIAHALNLVEHLACAAAALAMLLALVRLSKVRPEVRQCASPSG